MIPRGGVLARWMGNDVVVKAHVVGRYLWTTASIDVWIGDKAILETGGAAKVSGGCTAAFLLGSASHEATLTWRRGSLRSFPFELHIDGMAVAQGRVPTRNWWYAWWPFAVTVLAVVLWRVLS
jgi:hypothetical protein